MTTRPGLGLPDRQERYQGLYHDEWMQTLADAMAMDIARHIRHERYDFRTMPIELAPFYAWEVRALSYTRELGEVFERSALEAADRLNELAGTEEGWFMFARSLGGVGSLRYVRGPASDLGTPRERNFGVELFFSPPLNLVANPILLSHIAHVARIQTVPYTMELVSVNILNRFTAREYHYGVLHTTIRRVLMGEEVPRG